MATTAEAAVENGTPAPSGLTDVRAEVVVVRTPDGSGKLELTKFHTPADDQQPHAMAANRLGIRHVAFVIDDLNATVDGLRSRGVRTVGEVQDYQDLFRLCYLLGPEGIIIELIEQLSPVTTPFEKFIRRSCRERRPGSVPGARAARTGRGRDEEGEPP